MLTSTLIKHLALYPQEEDGHAHLPLLGAGLQCGAGRPRGPCKWCRACLAPSSQLYSGGEAISRAATPIGLAQCPALQRLLAGLQSNHTKEPELYLNGEESFSGSRAAQASLQGRAPLCEGPAHSCPVTAAAKAIALSSGFSHQHLLV